MRPFASNLFKLYHHHLKQKINPSKWSATQVRSATAYEGHGQSTISIMNKDAETKLFINSYSNVGFRLNNEILVLGPIILFPKMIFSWNIDDALDINDKSLCLFNILDPKIDVLVIGVGETSNVKLSVDILKFLRKNRTNVEILDTQNAVATYNFLNHDNRNVAAALIPPTTITVNDADMAATRKRQGLFMDPDGDPYI